jgi:hypothetical protein
MNLNQIDLTSRLLSELYADVLVESNATPVPGKKETKYLGRNEKNIIVFVSHPSAPFLPDAELVFLTNVLSACNLGLNDVAIINRHDLDEKKSADLMNELEAKNVLLFGMEPLSIGLPMNFPNFQLQQFNKRTYLTGPPLSEIEKDKTLKTKLWTSLKSLFCI